jgi:hypothetical protein
MLNTLLCYPDHPFGFEMFWHCPPKKNHFWLQLWQGGSRSGRFHCQCSAVIHRLCHDRHFKTEEEVI